MLKRLNDFYADHRDAIGITGIAAGMIGLLSLIVWLTIITSGWALVYLFAMGIGGLIVSALILLARSIWEEFFE